MFRTNRFNDAIMPGEKFTATQGELSEAFLNHKNNAYKIEKENLKGKKLDRLSVELRLGAIRAETENELQRILMELPERFAMTDSFVAEDLAFLFQRAKQLLEKREQLRELEGEYADVQ